MTKQSTPPELRTISLSRIALVDGFNPREHIDAGADEQLTDSIRRHGVIQPLVVAPGEGGDYELVAGHRRYHAAAAAAVTEVPVVVGAREVGNPLELAVVENLIREDVDPISEARGLERLIKSERLPEAVQDHIRAGELPPSTAKVLVAMAKVSEAIATAAAAIVVRGELAVHELEESPATAMELLADQEEAPHSCSRTATTQATGSTSCRCRTESRRGSRRALRPSRATRSTAERASASRTRTPTLRGHTAACSSSRKSAPSRGRSTVTPVHRRPRSQQARGARATCTRGRRAPEKHTPAAIARDGAEPGGQEAPSPQDLRRREREQEKRERLEADDANVRFGAPIAGGLHEVPLTRDVARLLGLLVLEREASSWRGGACATCARTGTRSRSAR